MAAGRSIKSLVGRRRKVDDEGEDDEGPVIVDDSQSEGSILSDGDEDGASSLGGERSTVDVGGEAAESAGAQSETGTNGTRAQHSRSKKKGKDRKPREEKQAVKEPPQSHFKAMADTDAMMHGLRIDDGAPAEEAVEFESMNANGTFAEPVKSVQGNGNGETPGQRQRREHDEYKKKRDADPAFIPNRGNFFMHDTRGAQHTHAPSMRGAVAGRGRGRGAPAVGGPFSPMNQMAQADRSAEQPWKHDLHDTINEEPAISSHRYDVHEEESARLFSKATSGSGQSRVLTFSTTTLVGKVQIKVLLPGMNAPITFSEVPFKKYARLPNHRPPLRRDKPVRISLPNRVPHYVFPSTERSFIFIPRQNRPNQPGLHRSAYQRSIGGHGYSSRRTSMYGGSVYAGSVYAPSIAASRRSSMAGMSRADAFSPTSFGHGMNPGSFVRPLHSSQPFSGVTTPSGPLSGHHTPTGMHIHTYPLPQQPAFQGTPTSTVHQPRPQKAISVTGIESPALLAQQNAPSAEPQPFQNQLPAHVVEPPPPAFGQNYYSPRQQYAGYAPQHPQNGTPLGGIPEQAVHAQSFPPPSMPPYGQGYYPPFAPQQPYYYSPPGPNGYPPPMSGYMPYPGYGMMPPPAQSVPPQQALQPHTVADGGQDQSGGQSEMVAHESNGMVFYTPRSNLEQQPQEGQNYQPAESFVPQYAMPGLPPPTPAPENSAYYYPHMAPQMFYPPAQGAQ
ncbi:hypothetical protein EJ03DRAFT_68724 [Teratosphaeria nubilosa]|uniref:Btz domain-containing protein n=1 Tax=Teratosphaeria nubilosa TaxID=161662 RepID=A0A6G1LMG5_9PEZI|nr:hypothetical protein EJ03DRAFT_68724 [Teratosphaeria nubilosa]